MSLLSPKELEVQGDIHEVTSPGHRAAGPSLQPQLPTVLPGCVAQDGQGQLGTLCGQGQEKASIRGAVEGADHSSGWCKRVLGKADSILLWPSP